MIHKNVKVMVLGGARDQSDFFYFHSHCETPFIKTPVEHGHYRKFLKQDKRKNFKVNK